MKRVPSKITMMELRSQPGEVIRAVEVDRRTITVTKQGHVAAYIVPDKEPVNVIHPDGTIEGELPITFRRDLGGHY